MSTDRMRLAAKKMRTNHLPYEREFWSSMADLLDHEAERVEAANRAADHAFGADASDFYRNPPQRFERLANAYLEREAL